MKFGFKGIRKLAEAEIRDVLENGPDEIEKAVDNM